MEIHSNGATPLENKKIVFLHEKLTKRRSDRYIVNIALAFQKIGYDVDIYTTFFDPYDCIEDIPFLDKLRIVKVASWVPRSIFGMFRQKLLALKAIIMAIRLIFLPRRERPQMVITDVSMVALYLLNMFTPYRLCFVETFLSMKVADACYEHSRIIPSLMEIKWIKMAHEVVVETIGFAEILKKSYPGLNHSPKILYHSMDIGLWDEPGINIQRIIPDLLENTIVFLTIGKFRRSSNFKLSLESFERLLELIGDKSVTRRFQLVIAGNCKSLEEKFYYNELTSEARDKSCASQITFLKQLPIIHEKTLILESAIMIHPAKNDVYSDFILKAMSLGKPIVATNRGIASKLLTHRVSGVIMEPEAKTFAIAMKKLMLSPHLQIFLGDMAKDTFQNCYSFDVLCEKVRNIMTKYDIEVEEESQITTTAKALYAVSENKNK
ncbi:unnamed protein product [Brassicogethes aeneus]|uniref:Alpha-1,3/1,6-mannosyltransferase ALG2 n=1 Tax=Brassicogethes aeneus TaxID=1431903 RepID=A0A9P0AKQ6_BRAAE|nr:unnamed protein product [Brassicogethes aeneus]